MSDNGQLDFVLEPFAGGQAYRIRSDRIRDPLIRSVYRMYGMTHTSRRGFPGAQPCSVMRENLHAIGSRHYVVAEKTDGTRYLMLVTVSAYPSDLVVLIDRSLSMWIVPMFFTPQIHQEKCLFDGELVFDEQTRRWTYQIFDLVGCGTRYRSRDTYIQRLKNARKLVNNDMLASEAPIMDVMVKRFYPTYKIDELISLMHTQRGCKTDGLIFTPVVLGVKPLRNREMFKWKDGTDNTVDFLLRYNSKTAKQLGEKRAKRAEEENARRRRQLIQDRELQQQQRQQQKKEEEENALREKLRQQQEDESLAETDSTDKQIEEEDGSSGDEEEEEEGGSGDKDDGDDDDDDDDEFPTRATVFVDFAKSATLAEMYATQSERNADRHETANQVNEQDEETHVEKAEQDESDQSTKSERSTTAESERSASPKSERQTSPQKMSAIDILKSVKLEKSVESSLSASPQSVELEALEFWLMNRSKKLVFFSVVDVDLNRDFLTDVAMRVASGEDIVVECRLEQGKWLILHHRSDRHHPNAEFTVEKTLQNISENITLDEIADVSRNNRPPGDRDRRRAHSESRDSRQQRQPVSFSNPFGAPTANYAAYDSAFYQHNAPRSNYGGHGGYSGYGGGGGGGSRNYATGANTQPLANNPRYPAYNDRSAQNYGRAPSMTSNYQYRPGSSSSSSYANTYSPPPPPPPAGFDFGAGRDDGEANVGDYSPRSSTSYSSYDTDDGYYSRPNYKRRSPSPPLPPPHQTMSAYQARTRARIDDAPTPSFALPNVHQAEYDAVEEYDPLNPGMDVGQPKSATTTAATQPNNGSAGAFSGIPANDVSSLLSQLATTLQDTSQLN